MVQKKAAAHGAGSFLWVWNLQGLLADAELFFGDDGAVACDVFAHQVVEKTTALTYQHLKSALSSMIFMI